MRKPKIKRFELEEFIDHCNKIHNNKYDYSLVELKRNSDEIIIVCPKHGKFTQIARNHYNGCRCFKCYIDYRSKLRTFTKDAIVSRAKAIWGDQFDYSEMIYTGILDKHEIKCNLCGNKFTQDLNNHINYKKNGCPNCRQNRGWKRTEWISFCEKTIDTDPKVYIIRLFNNNENFIKIGMTSRDVYKRMKNIPYEYEVLREFKGSPLFVYDKEIELHRKFVKYKYKPLTHFKGEFECYSLDILHLIKDL